MSKLSFAIRRAHMRAALITAGNQDIRYYLNGLLFEVTPAAVFIVSADGHRLSVFRDDTDARLVDESAPTERLQFIVPRDAIAQIKPDRLIDRVIVSFDSDAGTYSIKDVANSAEFSGPLVDGRFPDWRPVVPHRADGTAAQLNPAYVGDLAKIAKALGHTKSCATIHHNGHAGALITHASSPEYLGVILPMRNDDGLPNVAAFLRDGTEPAMRLAA